MNREHFKSLSLDILKGNSSKLQQAVEDIHFCLELIEEEFDELKATNQMLKVIVSSLENQTAEKQIGLKPGSSEWKSAMQSILNEGPIEESKNQHKKSIELRKELPRHYRAHSTKESESRAAKQDPVRRPEFARERPKKLENLIS